jgi:hypothetical protein
MTFSRKTKSMMNTNGSAPFSDYVLTALAA